MKNKNAILIVLGTIVVIVLLGWAINVSAAAKPKEEEKVTICHRGNSVTNPYQKISVDASAVDGEGNNDHTQHTGPVATSEEVAQALKDNKEKWGDIIPNVLNWTTEGIAIYDNNCEYVAPVTPPVEPPVTPPATPQVKADTTPTTEDTSFTGQGK